MLTRNRFPVALGLVVGLSTVLTSTQVDLGKIPKSVRGGQVYVRRLYALLTYTLTAGGGGATIIAAALSLLVAQLSITLDGFGTPIVNNVKGLNVYRHHRLMQAGVRPPGNLATTAVLGGGATLTGQVTIPLWGGNKQLMRRAEDFDMHAKLFAGSTFQLSFIAALTTLVSAGGLASFAGVVDVYADLVVKPKVDAPVITTLEEVPVPALNVDPTIAQRDGFLICEGVGRQLGIFASTEQTQVEHTIGDRKILDPRGDVGAAYSDFNNFAIEGINDHVNGTPLIDDVMPLVTPEADRRGANLTDAEDLAQAGIVHRPDVAANAYDFVREYSWRRTGASGQPADWLVIAAAKMGVNLATFTRVLTESKKPTGRDSVAQRLPARSVIG